MINFSVNGEKNARNKFKKLIDKLKNKTAMYKRIGVELLNEISDTFDKETHEGKQWKPLSKYTIERRRQGRSVGRPIILQDTGTLRRSFVPNKAIRADNNKVVVGTNIEYAPQHEFGEGRIPQRKILPSYRRGLKIAIKVTDKYINEKIKEAELKRQN